MNWTKEIPTVDGWYWVRSNIGVWVEDIRSGCVWEDCHGHGYWCNLSEYNNCDYEFYGPLEEPK